MANLDSYTSVATQMMVNLAIDEYRTDPSSGYSAQVLAFTDAEYTITYNSVPYQPLGTFLSITPTTSELRPSGDSITIGISGVPTDAIEQIIYSKIKGSTIKVFRRLSTVALGQQIAVQGYFFGRVNNWSIQEEFNVEERSASNIVLLECSSNFSVLSQKIAGRKTNPLSNKRFFPNDDGMNRVPIIKGTKFDFGAP